MTPQTNVATEALRTLHRIRRQLNDLEERQQRGPRVARAHQANLERLENDLAECQTEATALRIAADEKQLQLGSREAAVKRRQEQLLQASSNVEFQALKDQIAADQKANSVLTDEILEVMEKMDECARKVARAEAAVDRGRQETEKADNDVEVQSPRIQADIRRLEAELKEAEAALPGDFRELYRRLMRSRGEDALTPMNGQFCGGCNQHVPLNKINDLMLSHPIVCTNCGRLLYLPENYSPD